jgi:predicted nucleotidyltransferase
MKKSRDEIFAEIKRMLTAISPDARIILFGSQARGDAKPESDWDLLVILNKARIEISDFDAISYPIFEFGLKEGKHFSTKLYTREGWERRNFTPFYKNVEKEGVVL